jgi:hypothetical protein
VRREGEHAVAEHVVRDRREERRVDPAGVGDGDAAELAQVRAEVVELACEVLLLCRRLFWIHSHPPVSCV